MENAQLGDLVEFQGLQSAAYLNGTKGNLVEFIGNEQRWAVRRQHGGKPVKAKPKNLKLLTQPTSSSTVSSVEPLPNMPPPLFGLPPLKDEWGLICKESDVPDSWRRVAEDADTPEAAEKAVFLAMHNNIEHYEARAFPCLFPMGTGYFGLKRRVDVRYEDYVDHCLRQYTGAFRNNALWLDFTVSRAAALRIATSLPPMYKEKQENEEEPTLEDYNLTMLSQFTKAFPRKSFCLRYLLGDETFFGLAQLIMHGMTQEQRADVFTHGMTAEDRAHYKRELNL